MDKGGAITLRFCDACFMENAVATVDNVQAS